MFNKFVIFVVFATLAQSSFCSSESSTNFSFLSTDAESYLNQLATYQASTMNSKFESLHAVFEVIRRLLVEQVFDMTPSADYNSTAKMATSLSKVKEAYDYCLSSVLIASGKTACDAVEEARNTTHNELEKTFANFDEALEFIQSANSTEAAIEKLSYYETLVQASWTKIVQAVTDSLRTCAEITSTKELEVIETFEKGMDLNVHKGVNSIINALRYYTYAFITKSSDTTLISNVEEEQREADVVFLADVENMYGMVKTIYLNSYLNKSGIIDDLAKIELSSIIATDSYNCTMEILFKLINDYLIADDIGASRDVSTDDKTAIYEAGAKWVTGTHQILNAMNLTDASRLEEEREGFVNIKDEVASGVVFQYQIAKNASYNPNALSQIKVLGNKTDAAGEKYVEGIWKLITDGKMLTSNVRSEIQTLKSQAIKELNVITNGFTEAYSMLAEILSGKSDNVISGHLDSFSTIKIRIINATKNLANTIHAALITVRLADRT